MSTPATWHRRAARNWAGIAAVFAAATLVGAAGAGGGQLAQPTQHAAPAAYSRGVNAVPDEAERRQGFVPLFNGRDLSGWEHNGRPGTFVVKDGMLVGRRKHGSAYWLSTKRQYGDFELRLQYKIERGGNSGIFIRAPRYGRTSREGMEIQIYDQRPRPPRPHKGSTGAIYGVVAPSCFAEKPPGEWNDLWILCDGDLVRVTLNGKRIIDADMSKYPELRHRPRRGYIGLSAHTKTVWFRNIRIRVIGGGAERRR